MFFRTGACLNNLKTLQAVPGDSAIDFKHSLYSGRASHGERISRCASLTKRASLTVEAALVFPLFLFAVTGFLYLFLLLQLKVEVGRALTDAGKELAVSAELLEPGEGSSLLSVLYGKQKLDRYLSGRAAGGIVKGGYQGISLLESHLDAENAVLTLRADYRVVLPPGLSWFHPVRVAQSRTVRCWVGFRGRESAGTKGEEVVYVTEYGTVYHRSLECRHLKLSIRQVGKEEVEALRNGDGGKYYPCERCRKSDSAFVYITAEGNRYHESLSCSGLSRSIRTVRISETGGLPPCSVCGG